MDQLSDIEARHHAHAENLRRAFGAPVGGEPPAFAALLGRLAAKATSGAQDASGALSEPVVAQVPGPAAGRVSGRPSHHGPAGAAFPAEAVLAGVRSIRAAWSRPAADT